MHTPTPASRFPLPLLSEGGGLGEGGTGAHYVSIKQSNCLLFIRPPTLSCFWNFNDTELLHGYGANASRLMKERRVVMDIVELLNPLKLFLGVVCGSGEKRRKLFLSLVLGNIGVICVVRCSIASLLNSSTSQNRAVRSTRFALWISMVKWYK